MTKILGIDFAPLHIPLQRRLQTAAAFQWVLCFLFLGFGCLFFAIFLLFTRFYFITLLYAIFYAYDRKTSARGGRRSNWVRRWKLWEYFRDFFPISLVKTEDLAPNKTYIFGLHPHGILSVSAFANLGTEATGWSKKFPGLKPHLSVLKGQFMFPFYRDYLMCAGSVEASKESLHYLLSIKGNVVGVVVGGAVEALEARPGKYNLVLKQKKGFIKLALQSGATLVPVYSFGEVDLFEQADNPEGSFLKRFQTFMTQHVTGFSPPLFHGRGVFNYTFGIVPYRHPVTTVVGKPIDVEKVENPTKEDIEKLHKIYVDSLIKLFEDNKVKCGVDEKQHLNII